MAQASQSQLFRAIVENSSDLLLVVDDQGRLGYVSPSARAVLGWSVRELADRPLFELLSSVDAAAMRQTLRSASRDPEKACRLEATLRHSAGFWVPVEVTVTVLLHDPHVRGFVVTARDVGERKRLEQALTRQAYCDALTGLPNRVLFQARVEQALRERPTTGTGVALLFCDLDGFKAVNDVQGHAAGDQLLKVVATRLTQCVRARDTVARLGGDEFAVVLPGLGEVQDAVAAAAALRSALAAPFHVDGIELDIEASVGVVMSGDHGDDPTTLLQRVDVAMYVAKRQGLGEAVYDPATDGHNPTKLAMLGDLRRALQRGELLLHYQPEVDVASGEVTSVEALVRWCHPDRGLLMPDTFMPVAEHTGLIGALTRYILGAALAQTRIWSDQGRLLNISVNLSARNLLDERLPEQVAELLAAHGVPPELLTLEVTESAIVTEPLRAQHLLARLSSIGVRISIDDFGAGYTSLGQLRTLPVDELKIDRSFVSTMAHDRSNALIVHSVIDLGHNLKLSIVAEGVEDRPTLDMLASFHCDTAQGYHLSRPLAAEAFDTWYSTRGKRPCRTECGEQAAQTTPVP